MNVIFPRLERSTKLLAYEPFSHSINVCSVMYVALKAVRELVSAMIFRFRIEIVGADQGLITICQTELRQTNKQLCNANHYLPSNVYVRAAGQCIRTSTNTSRKHSC